MSLRIVAEDKTVEPTEILTFLGIEFDTLAMELRLPNEKLVELKHTLELFVQSNQIVQNIFITSLLLRKPV
jgi:hypothetical protein